MPRRVPSARSRDAQPAPKDRVSGPNRAHQCNVPLRRGPCPLRRGRGFVPRRPSCPNACAPSTWSTAAGHRLEPAASGSRHRGGRDAALFPCRWYADVKARRPHWCLDVVKSVRWPTGAGRNGSDTMTGLHRRRHRAAAKTRRALRRCQWPGPSSTAPTDPGPTHRTARHGPPPHRQRCRAGSSGRPRRGRVERANPQEGDRPSLEP
jgi:hypothetical protein